MSHFQLPSDIPWNQLADICVANQAPLTLRFILEKQRIQLDPTKNSAWIISVGNFIDIIVNFSPTVTRFEMDILVLWFFVLDLVAEENWIINKQSLFFSFNLSKKFFEALEESKKFNL